MDRREHRGFREHVSGTVRAALGYGRAMLLLGVIWLFGFVAMGAVVEFERRVDETRQAQVVIAEMRNQQGALLSIAFDPAVASSSSVPRRAETKARLRKAAGVLDASVATLESLGHSDAPATIGLLTERYYAFTDRLATLVADNAGAKAALELGRSQQPGGIQARLNAEFSRADIDYGREAARSRKVATIATILAIVFLLTAFSLAFERAVRARRRSEEQATTDTLTGLGNRRKLFADMERDISSLSGGQTLTVAIFDLDGFKAYNDTFGHPAGDALLARLGARLEATVADCGDAYRIGGDEFVVTTGSDSDTRLVMAAQAALTEHGEGFAIGCSAGSTRVAAGESLEQALHVADQRLYTNKRSGRRDPRTEAKDVLLQVLAEQNEQLVDHVGHVAGLAWSTAVRLDLPPDQVALHTTGRRTPRHRQSRHPQSHRQQTGPLDHQERMYMQRHSEIGERIVAAAPTLQEIAPIIRHAHERIDGTGYPDRLERDQIPICSRIIAVVDAYDAMTSERPYQQAMSSEDAVAELRNNAGTQFDPTVVAAFTSILAETFPSPQPETPITQRRQPTATRQPPLPHRRPQRITAATDALVQTPGQENNDMQDSLFPGAPINIEPAGSKPEARSNSGMQLL